MKAEDLMVGDRVLLFGDKPVKVDCIGNVEVYLSDENGIDWRVTYEHIKPIPLTPEILKKNGFRWTGSGDSTGMLSTPWGFDGIRYNIYVGLKKKTIEVHSAHPELRTESWRKVNKVSLEVCGCFVHELQHALRLCGIEKEIEL
jgi:hypothetical protein